MSAPHLTPTIQLVEISSRYWQSQCLYVAAQLGVADALKNGPLSPDAVAAQVGAKPAYLKRVLRALASLGVFVEDEQGRFGLTPLAEALRRDHPQSARDYVVMVADDYNWHAWGELLHGVKTGELPFDHFAKQPFFDYLAQHPDKEKVFADSMSNMASITNPAIAGVYPFGEINSLVEVGGSNGHLLATIARQYPNVQATLFDLPGVVQAARSNTFITAPDVAGRIRVEGGDMFKGVPAGADAYIVKSILHDWDDEHSVRVLENIRKVMAPNGRILVIEVILKPRNEPDPMKFMDLAMFTSSGGQERTEQEYRTLLARAGLKISRIFNTPSNRSIIEALPG